MDIIDNLMMLFLPPYALFTKKGVGVKTPVFCTHRTYVYGFDHA